MAKLRQVKEKLKLFEIKLFFNKILNVWPDKIITGADSVQG